MPNRSLLEFARKVNLSSDEIVRADVDRLLQSGWSELQIAEAVHVAALFSTFNRVTNAFGLASQGLLSLFDEHAGNAQAQLSIQKEFSMRIFEEPGKAVIAEGRGPASMFLKSIEGDPQHGFLLGADNVSGPNQFRAMPESCAHPRRG